MTKEESGDTLSQVVILGPRPEDPGRKRGTAARSRKITHRNEPQTLAKPGSAR